MLQQWDCWLYACDALHLDVLGCDSIWCGCGVVCVSIRKSLVYFVTYSS